MKGGARELCAELRGVVVRSVNRVQAYWHVLRSAPDQYTY
jgi:hypothetical protein